MWLILHTYITGKVPSFITCLINYSDATKSDVTCFICHKCDAWICVTRFRRRYRNPSNFFLLKSHNALFNFICINESVGGCVCVCACVLSCIIMYAFNPVLLCIFIVLKCKNRFKWRSARMKWKMMQNIYHETPLCASQNNKSQSFTLNANLLYFSNNLAKINLLSVTIAFVRPASCTHSQ